MLPFMVKDIKKPGNPGNVYQTVSGFLSRELKSDTTYPISPLAASSFFIQGGTFHNIAIAGGIEQSQQDHPAKGRTYVQCDGGQRAIASSSSLMALTPAPNHSARQSACPAAYRLLQREPEESAQTVA